MFNITHEKDGSLHTCVRLPISSLPYPLSIYEFTREDPEEPYLLTATKVQNPDPNKIDGFEFSDPQARVSLILQKVPKDMQFCDSSLIRIFEFDDVGTKIFVHMPEVKFVELSKLRWSEREKETGVCIEIKATVSSEWESVPTTVEYAWPDRQSPEATS